MAKKRGDLGVIYEVRPDPGQAGRWIVLRGGVPTGGFGNSVHQAIGSAIGEAQHEARTSDLTVAVMVAGKRTPEWVS